jgi:hypothetical protein
MQINGRRCNNRNGFGMAKELAEVCTTMVRHGEDFPTVWTTYLKNIQPTRCASD